VKHLLALSAVALILGAATSDAQQPAAVPPQVQLPSHQPGQSGPGALLAKGLVGFVAEQPQVLDLNERQLARARQIAEQLMARNAPLHARIIAITGGREMRDLPMAERMQKRQQAQPFLDSMRTNDDRATAELRGLLNRDQQARLDAARETFQNRAAAAEGGRGRMMGRGMGMRDSTAPDSTRPGMGRGMGMRDSAAPDSTGRGMGRGMGRGRGRGMGGGMRRP
jgi:hypothetical protein